MHKLFVALFFISIFLGSVFVVQNVGAVSNNVVIYQVQAGGAANTDGFLTAPATREFISIYNNSDQEVDITDWCLLNKSDKPTVCFNSIASNIFLHLQVILMLQLLLIILLRIINIYQILHTKRPIPLQAPLLPIVIQ